MVPAVLLKSHLKLGDPPVLHMETRKRNQKISGCKHTSWGGTSDDGNPVEIIKYRAYPNPSQVTVHDTAENE